MTEIPDILKKIVEVKRGEIAEILPEEREIKSKALDAAPTRDFRAALAADGLSIIAEVKKASPSAGEIAGADFNPAEIAESYESGGADAISVLTDRVFFKGTTEYLTAVSATVSIPVLRKDFIIAPVQIYEARAIGADTFLLISAILEKSELADLIALGRSLDMEPLVESHNEAEMEKAIDAETEIFGVNSRNLHTFEVDLKVAERLASMIPENALKVAESGIKQPEDAQRMAAAGYDAVLIGETLTRLPSGKRREWIEQAKN